MSTILFQILHKNVIFFFSAVQRMILKLLVELKGEIKEMRDDVQQLRNGQPLGAEEFPLPDEVSLPVTSLEALGTLERELKANTAFQNHLVCISQLCFL